MWKIALLSATAIMAAYLSTTYLQQNNYCSEPQLNIASKSDAIAIIKRNIEWLTGGNQEHIETLENYRNPVIADQGKSGNGWSVWETANSKNGCKEFFVMYSPSSSEEDFSIECAVACGGIVEGQCWTLNRVGLDRQKNNSTKG